jgi:hypothetical protein
VNVEKIARARAAIAMLESVSGQIDQIYTESAKGVDADILTDLGAAKKALRQAQQKQLLIHDAEMKK